LAAAIALCGLPAAASGKPQLLDLGAAPSAPAAGAGVATKSLADDLLKRAEQLLAAPGAAPQAKAAAAVRVLAAQLLSTGEALGQAGSGRIVMGRTLARGMKAADELIGAAQGPTAAADLALAAHDLGAAAAAMTANDADIHKLVRDGMAGLLQIPRAGPGPRALAESNAPPLKTELDAWRAAPGVLPETIAALTVLDATLESARQWAAYRPASDRTRESVRAAGRAILTPAAWLTPAARAKLGEEFGAAVGELVEKRIDTRLKRLARLGRIIASVNTLEDTNPGKKVRQAVLAMIFAPAADYEAESRVLDSFERSLRLALVEPEDERNLVRVVRLAVRSVSATGRQTGPKLVLALPDILARPGAMTEPGILATISAHKTVVNDWAMLSRLSAELTAQGIDAPSRPGAAGPSARWVRISDRVFKLGQDLARADTRDAAMTDLRQLAGQIDRFLELPGEASLREGSAAWGLLTGGKEKELLAEISDRRGGWADGWDKQGYAGSSGDVLRLAALRSLMEVVYDLVPVVEATNARAAGDAAAYGALQAWAGWELGAGSLAELCRGMVDQSVEAVRLITAGDAGKTTEAVERMRREFAAATLAGRLARLAQSDGRKAVGDAGALLEVATGGEDAGGWMPDLAAEAADVCRYGEEAAAAWKKIGAQDRAAALTKFVNLRAAAAIEKLDRLRE